MREGPSRTCGERLARQESVCTSQGDKIKYIFNICHKDFLKILKNINIIYHTL